MRFSLGSAYFLAVGVFLSSLYSFYFYGASFLTVFGFLLIIFAKLATIDSSKFKINAPFLVFYFLFVVSVVGVLFGNDLDFTRFCVFLSFIIFFLIFGIDDRKFFPLSKILFLVLSIHAVFFYIQFFSYYALGFYVDYLGLFGLESRNFGGTFSFLWGAELMRASGLFSEPGTYSCFLAPIIALYARYRFDAKSKILFYACLISLALSLSTFGLVFFLIISIFLLGSISYSLIYMSVSLVFAMPYFYWRFFVRPDEGINSGLGFRFEYISAALENFTDVKGFFFGNGAFSVQSFNFSNHGADNDSGLIFYILYNFGGLSLLVLMLAVLYSFLSGKIDKYSLFGILILLASKVSFFAIVFPVYIYLLWLDKKRSSAVWVRNY